MYMKLILRQLGVQVYHEATNGRECLRLYAEKHPDFVLMDINMPGMDGIETLEELLKRDPDAVVIMLTAQASRNMVERSGQAGAVQYIRKDTSKEEMKEILEETFDDIFEEDEI